MSSFHAKQSARTLLRLFSALFIASFMLVQTGAPALAGTTGILTGTVTDSATQAPIADVHVTAVAPTGRYSATTNGRGFFSIAGVAPDAYTVSFSATGYEPVSVPGQNVFADLPTNVSATLVKSLKTIAHVTSRSAGGAFQPNQTVNTYNVTQHQVQTILGTSLNLAESTLITSLPGGSPDSSGYPVIRGGRENEENFEFEGIPYTDAFTNQFTNSLSVPGLGLQSIQLTPGLGNASQDNYGTGTFNLISRRGSYPGFATGLFGLGSPAFQHIVNAEYGFASPNGRFSGYLAISDNNQNSAFNTTSMNCQNIGTCFSRFYQTKRETLANFVYKFGRDNNQALQFFTDIGQSNFYTGNAFGGTNGNLLCYDTCDPFTLQQMMALSGFSVSSIPLNASTCPTPLNCVGYTTAPPPGSPASAFTAFNRIQLIQSSLQLYPGQSFPDQTLGSTREMPQINYQPNMAWKLGYIWNINSSSVLEAMGYHLDSVTTFDLALSGGYASFNTARRQLQGGRTSGLKMDYTNQLSDKHLLKAGGEYKYLVPVFDTPANDFGFFNLAFEHSEQFDFWTPAQCASIGVGGGCGYIYNNGVSNVASVQPIPNANETTSLERHDWAGYIDDTWSPNDKLKVEGGLRLDGMSIGYPTAQIDPYTCTSVFLPTYQTNSSGVLLTTPSTNPNAFTTYRNPVTGVVTTSPLGTCPVATFPQLTNQSRRPIIPEPILAATYRLGPDDSIRASWGRSVNFPTLGLVDFSANINYFGGPNQQFFKIPAYTSDCGPLTDQNCANYAEQLYWDNAREWAGGVPLMPVRPTVFVNADFSWEHQFTRGLLNGISFKLTPWYRKAYDETALVSTPKIVGGIPLTNPITGALIFNPPVANNLGKNQADGFEMQFTKEQTYGLSGQVSFTYQNEFSSVIPASSSEDFYPSIPAQSVLLGNVYRVGFLSPFVASFDFSYQTRNGWRINPQTQWNIGYPIGPGFITSAFINGQPFNIPFTNACPGCSTTGTGQYVDPMNPGSFYSPNIAANRGIPMGNANGGKLSHPSSITNLVVEYNAPKTWTAGVEVFNLFGSLYGGPSVNGRWQPLGPGVSGPLTGQNSTGLAFPQYGMIGDFGTLRNGRNAYIDTPNGIRRFVFYFQVKM